MEHLFYSELEWQPVSMSKKNIEKNKKGYVNQITYPFSYKIRGMYSNDPIQCLNIFILCE
ncbi:hypothetical protein XO29_0022 [Bacillus phage phiS58]|uniref:Uncharacterized protein n=1 Tax=Bacillus phage phiS58 TaxID=1643327 RepID=A0A0S2MVI9_9CAUD|nr:hypothetical protein XO29_0022 [Bacillus phage phiS58]